MHFLSFCKYGMNYSEFCVMSSTLKLVDTYSLPAHLQGPSILLFLTSFLWAPHPVKLTCRAASALLQQIHDHTTTLVVAAAHLSGPTGHNLVPPNPPPGRVHDLTFCLT